MLFCSTTFALFFAVVFVAYWAVPWQRGRVLLLLAASVYFYASWNPWLVLVVLASATLDFFLALGIEAVRSPRLRRLLVGVSVVSNLGLLCWFKYVNFFLGSLEEGLRAVGASSSFPLLSVVLPIGISFYTFEAINYVVDVYRGQVRAARNLLHFLLFILFFPHLIAGPIVRARDFLRQISRPKRWDWLRMQTGAGFFLLGLFKKLVIADRMALFVDPVFADPTAFRPSACWLAVLAYALQIYGDFSGYSDMAIGTAHLLGYRLAANFNMPYVSANVAEFWRRWHISLSSWLRDYLFIPLGGSRGGRWKTARNLLLTMVLGGLWHGANWTFVIWGMLHGLLLIAHRLFQGFCADRPALERALRTVPGTAGRTAVTFLSVALCWVLFRAPTFGSALLLLGRLLGPPDGRSEPQPAFWFTASVLALLGGYALHRFGVWRRALECLPAAVVGTAYALLLTTSLLLAPPSGKVFIYFQF
jgi:alginate O-acetyltransferase complex protein AlgI